MIINVNEDKEDRKNIAAIEESGSGGGSATFTSPSVWYDYSTVLIQIRQSSQLMIAGLYPSIEFKLFEVNEINKCYIDNTTQNKAYV